MLIETKQMISMTDANQNFSKVARTVEKDGMAVILKNNQPRYVVMDFEDYESIAAALDQRAQTVQTAARTILEENLEAFLELAK